VLEFGENEHVEGEGEGKDGGRRTEVFSPN